MNSRIIRADDSREYFFHEGCYINELCNLAADNAVSIARARVTPGQTTRWHYLKGTTERYVIIAGRGRVELEGETASEVAAGDVVLIPAGKGQRIHNCGEQDLVFLAVCTPRFCEDAYVDIEQFSR